jgi:tetratricopeptide (TPR) repeat protein
MTHNSKYRQKVYVFIFTAFILLFLNSCSKGDEKHLVQYSTTSDSTLFYYNKGWKQIMDYGDYSKAEMSYRKALTFDDNFLVGKSVLARLTLDLHERLSIYKTLETNKSSIKGDERLILDVYIALTHYTNLRDQKSPDTKKALHDALALSETNFGKIIHKYPQEIYLKSEYIEILHSIYGAEKTLDSIKVLTTDAQKLNPFILGYKAILTAETENYNEAINLANTLVKILKAETVARPDAILADIYLKKGDYKMAKIHADKAHNMDPKNLDASRLKEKIDKLLEE